MHSNLLYLSFLSALLLCSSALTLLPGERAYSAQPLAALYHTPSHVTQRTVNRLLDVLQKFGLTEVGLSFVSVWGMEAYGERQFYGVYALHTHLHVGDDEVLYLTYVPHATLLEVNDSHSAVKHQRATSPPSAYFLTLQCRTTASR
ncbi:hypothetical protein CALCODRAFT_494439 [Calocera cornea HHB12733]|uniref:Uncharacterized protein n=1 Tax=Calocera cornea HHB12733 TaxID=1353952 RepID=A0A165H198_9BASI|nr:hypothetical protein CALCODRAFT_494439 [Calocera cornea HHB12733]